MGDSDSNAVSDSGLRYPEVYTFAWAERKTGVPRNLVEAAGVEPASEKARREKNYVRFRFVIVGRRLRTGKKTAA